MRSVNFAGCKGLTGKAELEDEWCSYLFNTFWRPTAVHPSLLIVSFFLHYHYINPSILSRRQITGLRKGKGQELRRTMTAVNTTTRPTPPLHFLRFCQVKRTILQHSSCRVIVYIRHSCRATQCRYHLGVRLLEYYWDFTITCGEMVLQLLQSHLTPSYSRYAMFTMCVT
jgi:hypothetical protein